MIIKIDIKHCYLRARLIEIRVDDETTLSQLRENIYRRTGTNATYQQLFLIQNQKRILLKNEGALLKELLIEDQSEIFVNDRNPYSTLKSIKTFQDIDSAPSTEIDWQKYFSLTENTVYSAIQKRLQDDPDFRLKYENSKKKYLENEKVERSIASKFQLDQVIDFELDQKFRGVIRFIGQFESSDGTVCGIEIIHHQGKYSECDFPGGVGLLVRPSQLLNKTDEQIEESVSEL